VIVKGQYGVSPTLVLSINGVAVDYFAVNEVELLLEVNLHDMLTITMAGLPPRAMSEYRNQPVYCSMDIGGGFLAEFHGYVVHVGGVSTTSGGLLNGSPFQDAKLVCLGTSYEMRGGDSRVWKDERLQDVALELSSEYGFSVTVPQDSLVLSPMLQDNESDWQFLVRYAGMLGFDVTMHGTDLHIFDPYKAYSHQTSFHRLRTAKDLRAGVVPTPGQISKFKVTMAEHHPDGVYKDTVVAVHQDDNQIFDVSLRELRGLTAPARFSNRLRDSVDTYDQAVRVINADSKEQYDYRATATVLGLPGCMPGGVVQVDSYGTTEVDALWYVQSVRHHLTSGAFISELSLARNINSELLPSSVKAYTSPPAPRLVDGKWVPTKRLLNVYT
jgi:phage protein D